MHLITFIHNTDDLSDFWIKKVFILELILLILSYPLCMLCIYLLFYTKQYHPNLSILMKHLFLQYPIQMSARIVLIFKMFQQQEDDLREDTGFMLACYVRSYLIFIAFYFSFFAMIERTFATIYLRDYENRQRKAIGYILTAAMHVISYTSASFFIFEVISVWPILFSFVLCNVLAFLICHMNALLNQKKFEEYVESSTPTTHYNLSERYQLAENLAVATLFKKGIVLFIFFSLLCCSFMCAEEIDDDVYLRNWLHVSFNMSAVSYGILVPLALFHYNEEWRLGVRRLWARIRHNRVEPARLDRSPSAIADPVLEAKLATDRYFSQLAKDWGIEPRSFVM